MLDACTDPVLPTNVDDLDKVIWVRVPFMQELKPQCTLEAILVGILLPQQ